MVTGFNTDVKYNGRVFHVQTEERGPSNPVVVTLVYCGGQIVTAIEESYADAISSLESLDDDLRQIMQEQHRDLIREILNGKYDPGILPYGHDLVGNRGLDELVLDYLQQAESGGEEDARDGSLEDPESPDDSLAVEALRVARTGRVLNRLERMLVAAQRVREESERAAIHAAPEADPVEDLPHPPEPLEKVVEPANDLPAVDAEVRDHERRDRRRTPLWIPIAVAVTVLGAAIALFWMGGSAEEPSRVGGQAGDGAIDTNPDPVALQEPPVPSSRPADDVGSPEPPAAEPPRVAPQNVDPTPPPGDSPPPPVTAATPPPDRVAPRGEPAAPEETGVALGSTTSGETAGPAPGGTEIPRPETGRSRIMDAEDVDLLPRPRKRDLPRYTSRARRLRHEGTVLLRVLVDEYGTVEQVELLEGIAGSDLDDTAMEVARGWEFSPARKGSEPVKVWREVALEFSILPNRTTSVRIQGL